MANPHYGNIGDVWKHLPLGELLRLVDPEQYWESHAGDAWYPWSESPSRMYGAGWFMAKGPSHEHLAQTAYTEALMAMMAIAGDQPRYPGSALMALRAPRAGQRRFLFCDLDGGSIASLREAASRHDVNPDQFDAVQGDGIETCWHAIGAHDAHRLARTVLLIDPFRINESNAHSRTSADLFTHAATHGVMTLLWYCARNAQENQSVQDHMARLMSRLDPTTHRLWRGEMTCVTLNEPAFDPPGVGMCGLFCANLSGPVESQLGRLGEAMVSLYSDATLPDGSTGALRFEQSIGTPATAT